MITYTINEVQNNLYHLIDQTAQSHQPITIIGKNTNAVLISSEDWNAVQKHYIYITFQVLIIILKTLKSCIK